MGATPWTDQQIDAAKAVLGKTPQSRYHEGIQEIGSTLGRTITDRAVREAFRRRGLAVPISYCVGGVNGPAARLASPNGPQPIGASAPMSQVAQLPEGAVVKLVEALRGAGGKLPWDNLCDQLDVSPGKAAALLETAQKVGVRVKREGDAVALEPEPLVVPRPAPEPKAARPTDTRTDPAFAKLLEVTKRGPVDFEALCDRLELAPRKCRDLIERAQGSGYAFNVAHNSVAFRLFEADGIRDVDVAPVVGERQRVAVISDTHLGSRYCLRAQLQEFVHMAYESGVREILHPGDVLDGCYRHGVFELSHAGIDEQTRDLFETLPQLPGLSYHAICGNHDDTFSDAIGIDAGQFMQNWFQANGRNDLRFHGRRGAYIRLRGATIELWHPRKSGSYSLSYHLQNHIRDYAVGAKPDVLLAGHWHVWVYLEQRGVHALACGTFQGNGSAFSKSLGGAPSIGGTLLSWEVTADGTLRRFSVERSAYYEHERPREIAA